MALAAAGGSGEREWQAEMTISTERRQYISLLKLMKRHGLSEIQAAEAMVLFFHSPDFAFCRAARFVWRARNGRGPDAAPVAVVIARKDAAG